MKNIITTILITLLTYSLYAQVPGIGQVPLGMKYQAVARDAQGQPMSNQTVALRFTIMQGSADGTVVFTEQQSESANDVGLFVLTIGEINNTDFSNIDWRLGDHFLKVEVNDGGWVDLGTHQLLSVPYAMTAGNGKQKGGVDQDYIVLHGANGNANNLITSQATGNHGQFIAFDEEGNGRGWLYSDGNSGEGAGKLLLRGENDSPNLQIGTWGDNNHGAIALRDDEGQDKILIYSNGNQGGRGDMQLRGGNGNMNILLSNQGDENHGAVRMYDAAGAQKVRILSNPAAGGRGGADYLGANNNFNVSIGHSGSNFFNHGRVCVHDTNGAARACMHINSNGQGEVFADIKNFRMDHPKDPTKEIWYACIEGPEAAAYERGTAQLINGEARVNFSEHFELVVNPETATFVLTPRSADSEGLAITEQDESGFVVKELRNGTGNYKFDWEVKCVRKGYEDFEVIRDKKRMEEMMGIDHTQENK